MKRASEGDFGKALRAVDDSVPTYVYRLPDPKAGAGVSNWKPCDFMAFSLAHSIDFATDPPGSPPMKLVDVAWFECKDTDAVNAFPLADIRPSQWQGVTTALRLGIPYWLAVYWRRHRSWTISDAGRIHLAHLQGPRPTSISRDHLMTRYGVQSSPRELTSYLKSILAGEL